MVAKIDPAPAVLVLGASSRLGAATCAELTRRGARVAGTFFRGEARMRELGGSVELTRRLDLGDASAIDTTVAEIADTFGGLTALVHCATVVSASAGEPRYDTLADVDPTAFAHMLAINVTSPLLAARAFARTRPARPGAPRNLVLVGSVDGAKSVPAVVSYATSKGAVVAMARALAKEFGPAGILVNVPAPGMLEEGITAIVPEAVKREYLKHSASKRFGSHAEIARSIAWLALENTYVTGQTLMFDGGL